MKISTWNLNSINARIEHLIKFIKSDQSDIYLLQELKSKEDNFPKIEMTSEETEFLSEIEGSNKNKAKEIFSLFNKGGFELAKNPDFPFEQVIFGSAGIV